VITENAQVFMRDLLNALGLFPSPSSTVVLHLDPQAQLATVEVTIRVRREKSVAAPNTSAHTHRRAQASVGSEHPMS